MMFPHRLMFASIAVAVLAGCASSSKVKVAQNAPPTAPVAKSAPVANPQANRAPESTAKPVAFSGATAGAPKQAAVLVENKSAPSPGSRSTAIIGLYGELIADNPEAGTEFDGGINLGQITTATEGSCVDPDVDRTGTKVAFSSTMHRKTADIYVKAVTGKTITQVTNDPADDVMPAFGPDGRSIAFASNRGGNWDVFITTTDGGHPVQLTTDSDHELAPSWSPDGRMIAYCKFGSQSSRWEMWAVDVNNPGVRHFLDYGVFPQWCPDVARNKILFQRAKQRGSRDYSVWTVDYINGQAMYPTEIISAANAALINPSWSPDGARIVFVAVIDPQNAPADRPVQSDLWVVNLDGSNRTSLTNGQFANFQPAWASDGTVYFVSDRSGLDNIWAVRTRGDEPAPSVAPETVANVDANSQPIVEAQTHP